MNSRDSSSHSKQREAIEAAIEQFGDGDGAPVGKVVHAVAQEFGAGVALSRTADLYNNGELAGCGDARIRVTPGRNERLKTDGGNRLSPSDVDPREDAFRPADEVIHASPDPKTAHADDLLGRRIRVDWGERTDVGQITEVRDHHERDRELSIRIPTEQGRRMQTFAPARTDCELVKEDGGDSQ